MYMYRWFGSSINGFNGFNGFGGFGGFGGLVERGKGSRMLVEFL